MTRNLCFTISSLYRPWLRGSKIITLPNEPVSPYKTIVSEKNGKRANKQKFFSGHISNLSKEAPLMN